MKIIHQVHPEDFVKYTTQQIRDKFLLNGLVEPGGLHAVYTHYDRMIIGAACPTTEALSLPAYEALKADNFLDRREVGILNIGAAGTITADGQSNDLEKLDCLYIGKGTKNVTFESKPGGAAKFIFFSCPAHQSHPVQLMKSANATPAEMGSPETANHRTINKYIHLDGLQSCQLVMGATNFKPGSLWNTMPAHTHDRRMEAYFYFDLPENQRVIHFMGEPHETRHMFLNNDEGILSPAWSIHSGVATASYSFIWAMCGENLSFTDMDFIDIKKLQ